jgi:hypothetical protein
MNFVVHIPDEFAERLSAGGDVERQALEALAMESYRAGRLTKAELRQVLGIATRDQLEGFLRAHDIRDPLMLTDIEREVNDIATVARAMAELRKNVAATGGALTVATILDWRDDRRR